MYIKLKDKSLSKRINEFLEKNDIEYFTSLDGENINYAILYVPNNFKEEKRNTCVIKYEDSEFGVGFMDCSKC